MASWFNLYIYFESDLNGTLQHTTRSMLSSRIRSHSAPQMQINLPPSSSKVLPPNERQNRPHNRSLRYSLSKIELTSGLLGRAVLRVFEQSGWNGTLFLKLSLTSSRWHRFHKSRSPTYPQNRHHRLRSLRSTHQ
jgi:hypothetical protein